MDLIYNRFQKIKDKPINSGGFSNIWLVYDTKAKKSDSQVILKEFKEGAKESYRKHEVFILQKLNEYKSEYHARYIDHDKNYKWVALEYLSEDKWATLNNEMGNIHKLDYVEKVKLSKKILEAYKDIQKAAYHKDIAPNNIFLSKDYKQIKIIDFGASVAVPSIGPDDISLGKYSAHSTYSSGYEAPEDFKKSDPRGQIDVYKIGIILHEIFTGVGPDNTTENGENFKDVDSKSIRKVHNERHNKSLSSEFLKVLSQSLKQHPADRYANANKMLEDFELKIFKPATDFSYRARYILKKYRSVPVFLILIALGFYYWEDIYNRLNPSPTVIETEKIVEKFIEKEIPAASSSAPAPAASSSAPAPAATGGSSPNIQGELRVSVPEKEPESPSSQKLEIKPFCEKIFPPGFFHLCSTYDEVISAMGTPDNLSPNEYNVGESFPWFKRNDSLSRDDKLFNGYIQYKDSPDSFSKIYFFDEKVISWEDKGNLKLYDFSSDSEFVSALFNNPEDKEFNAGSNISKVLALQGNPAIISYEVLDIGCCTTTERRKWIYEVKDQAQDASVSFTPVWVDAYKKDEDGESLGIYKDAYNEKFKIPGKFDYRVECWDQVQDILKVPPRTPECDAPALSFSAEPAPAPSSSAPAPAASSSAPASAASSSAPASAASSSTPAPAPSSSAPASAASSSAAAPAATGGSSPLPPPPVQNDNSATSTVEFIDKSIAINFASGARPYQMMKTLSGNHIYVSSGNDSNIHKYDSSDLSLVSSLNMEGAVTGLDRAFDSASINFNGEGFWSTPKDTENMISFADDTKKVFIKNILGSENICTWQLPLDSALLDVAFHDNKAYVLDDNNKRIYKFGLSGGVPWQSDGCGISPYVENNGLSNIRGHALAVSDNGVYVINTNANRVDVYSLMLNERIDSWGSFGNGDYKFNAPQGISIDSSGNVYVMDTENHAIKKYNHEGEFIAKWGNKGKYGGDEEFYEPVDCICTSEISWVLDRHPDRKHIKKVKLTDNILSSPAPSPAQNSSSSNGKILYYKDRNLYYIKPDGSDNTLINLGFTGVFSHPIWHPDGDKVTFAINGLALYPNTNDDTLQIHNAYIDGSGAEPEINRYTDLIINTGNKHETEPFWLKKNSGVINSSGHSLIFTSYRVNGNGEIFVAINGEGGGVNWTNTYAGGLNGINEEHPEFCQNGNKWVYISHVDGNKEIYIADPYGYGTTVTNISNTSGDEQYPTCSPDGTKIAYGYSSFGGPTEIWTMNSDGSDKTKLVSGYSNNPQWSPDGTKIAYEKNNGQIWTMDANGSNQQYLVDGEQPDWGP